MGNRSSTIPDSEPRSSGDLQAPNWEGPDATQAHGVQAGSGPSASGLLPRVAGFTNYLLSWVPLGSWTPATGTKPMFSTIRTPGIPGGSDQDVEGGGAAAVNDPSFPALQAGPPEPIAPDRMLPPEEVTSNVMTLLGGVNALTSAKFNLNVLGTGDYTEARKFAEVELNSAIYRLTTHLYASGETQWLEALIKHWQEEIVPALRQTHIHDMPLALRDNRSEFQALLENYLRYVESAASADALHKQDLAAPHSSNSWITVPLVSTMSNLAQRLNLKSAPAVPLPVEVKRPNAAERQLAKRNFAAELAKLKEQIDPEKPKPVVSAAKIDYDQYKFDHVVTPKKKTRANSSVMQSDLPNELVPIERIALNGISTALAVRSHNGMLAQVSELDHVAGLMTPAALNCMSTASLHTLFEQLTQHLEQITMAGHSLAYSSVSALMAAGAVGLRPNSPSELISLTRRFLAAVANNFVEAPIKVSAGVDFVSDANAFELFRHVHRLLPREQQQVMRKLLELFRVLNQDPSVVRTIKESLLRQHPLHSNAFNQQVSAARAISGLTNLMSLRESAEIARLICQWHGLQAPIDTAFKAGSQQAARQWQQFALQTFKGDGRSEPYVVPPRGPIKVNVHQAGKNILQSVINEHMARQPGDPLYGRTLELLIGAGSHASLSGRSPLLDTIRRATFGTSWHAAYAPHNPIAVLFAPATTRLAGKDLVWISPDELSRRANRMPVRGN